MFSIPICCQSGDQWQSKTVSNDFYLRLSIVLTFSIAAYPVCKFKSNTCHVPNNKNSVHNLPKNK